MSEKCSMKDISKWVHIDMKGGPPKLSYLLELMKLIQRWGGTGVLVEWEDMFPWSGPLSPLARPGHYSTADIGHMVTTAADLGLELVPLVQTFGHMEFVLKHQEFRYVCA